MSINKTFWYIAVALSFSSVAVLTGCNSSPADLVSPTEETASAADKIPPGLQDYKYSTRWNALDCNPDKINKDQKSTCEGTVQTYYEEDVRDAYGNGYLVTYKVESTPKVYLFKGVNVSVSSKSMSVGYCKVTVKAKGNNVWVGPVGDDNGGKFASPVIAQSKGKIYKWKKY